MFAGHPPDPAFEGPAGNVKRMWPSESGGRDISIRAWRCSVATA
jgi:hypothetical protein